MNEIKEHDTVIVDGVKFGTVVHIYPDNETYEVEIHYFKESVVETVKKEQITHNLKNIK